MSDGDKDKDRKLTIQELETGIAKLAKLISLADNSNEPRFNMLSDLIMLNLYFVTNYQGFGVVISNKTLFQATNSLMKMHGIQKPMSREEFVSVMDDLKDKGLVGDISN